MWLSCRSREVTVVDVIAAHRFTANSIDVLNKMRWFRWTVTDSVKSCAVDEYLVLFAVRTFFPSGMSSAFTFRRMVCCGRVCSARTMYVMRRWTCLIWYTQDNTVYESTQGVQTLPRLKCKPKVIRNSNPHFRKSVGSLLKCIGFIVLSAWVILRSSVKISRWLYEKL